MQIFQTAALAKDFISGLSIKGKSIGFVPTMGALHDGHISLVKAALQKNEICVVSIFVNPTQFNNTVDLEKYPKTTGMDINLLEAAGCHILYLPSLSEVYPPGDIPSPDYNIGDAEFILEGEFRPGHFKGVVQVVDILLKTIEPTVLYLGAKDFQQFFILEKFCAIKHPGVLVEKLPTRREPSGLAMSSRNMRLDDSGKNNAANLYKVLTRINDNIDQLNWHSERRFAIDSLLSAGIKVEYLEIAEKNTMQILPAYDTTKETIILIAAWVNNVRLIDNLEITKPSFVDIL